MKRAQKRTKYTQIALQTKMLKKEIKSNNQIKCYFDAHTQKQNFINKNCVSFPITYILTVSIFCFDVFFSFVLFVKA